MWIVHIQRVTKRLKRKSWSGHSFSPVKLSCREWKVKCAEIENWFHDCLLKQKQSFGPAAQLRKKSDRKFIIIIIIVIITVIYIAQERWAMHTCADKTNGLCRHPWAWQHYVLLSSAKTVIKQQWHRCLILIQRKQDWLLLNYRFADRSYLVKASFAIWRK